MADSPSASENGQPSSGKVAFRFCRECSNLLYPKEDKVNNALEFACRTCAYSEPATTACIYNNTISSTVGDTAGITQDVGQDPTVGLHIPDFCTLCGQEIRCEICGQVTDRGFWLEVEDTDPPTEAHTPPPSPPLQSHDQTSQQLDQQQQRLEPPTDQQSQQQ
ncbi:hypothetical protein EJ06DRAFT_529828 [Trichodelitschia bisporula]|uniref:DNA-directed RNA polymerase II subunit RPB9-like zinc ribbon domain-containing protein n=1 Tax=Trichodelitschia bisporula TaxID=703511 RepID=A0A6G1HXT0_9PEZI|nr:hypothetical protein EJ06DRAFT_529828 [Trichodelitschia bisporula]